MINSGKDMIAERYQQDNPEGARLVSDDKKSEPAIKKNTRCAKTSSKADKPGSGETPKKSEQAKPRTSKKTGNTGRKPKETHEETPSIKTPSVLKLVENATLAENQVIAAGKSRIPRQLRGIEPLSRVIRREAEAESAAAAVQASPMVRKNLTGMIIEAEAPLILKRFNACDCDRCRSELIRLTEAEIPARYITIPELADISYTGFSDDERLLIESVKKTAVSVMIRLMIGNKRRNFHYE